MEQISFAIRECGNMQRLRVSISDPYTESFGPARYTSYRVTTESTTLGCSVTCRKRYSDFESLRTELMAQWPGVVIPRLPEKHSATEIHGYLVNRFSAEFVEQRRTMLEDFCNQALAHPIIVSLPSLASFLNWKPDFSSEAESQASLTARPEASDSSDGVDPLWDAPRLVSRLRADLESLHSMLCRLSSRQRESALDFFELSKALEVAAINALNETLRPALTSVAEASVGVAAVAKRQAEHCRSGKLMGAVRRFMLVAEALEEQLKARAKLGVAITQTEAKLSESRANALKLSGRSDRIKRLGDLEEQGSNLCAKVEQLRAQRALLTGTLVWELERLESQKHALLREALREFAAANASFAKDSYGAWNQASFLSFPHDLSRARAPFCPCVTAMFPPFSDVFKPRDRARDRAGRVRGRRARGKWGGRA